MHVVKILDRLTNNFCCSWKPFMKYTGLGVDHIPSLIQDKRAYVSGGILEIIILIKNKNKVVQYLT